MAVDPRKRQKKLERQKAKQKAERQIGAASSRGLAARLEDAAAARSCTAARWRTFGREELGRCC